MTVALALLAHPIRAIRAIWTNHVNVWANVAPTGVVGWLWLPVLVPSAIVLMEGGIAHGGMNFALPGFQNLIIVPLSAVGIIGLCAACRPGRSRTRRLVCAGLLSVLTLNAIVWAAVWLPQVSTTWLRVSPAAASVLRHARSQIPAGDEVVVSQGVAGGFAARRSVYPIMRQQMTVPASTRSVWFVITPSQGIETAAAAAQYADIGQLAGAPNVRLVLQAAGVWVFRWTPPAGVRRFHLGAPQSTLPAYTVGGPTSIGVLTGPDTGLVSGHQRPLGLRRRPRLLAGERWHLSRHGFAGGVDHSDGRSVG